jgi:hypothetical protein
MHKVYTCIADFLSYIHTLVFSSLFEPCKKIKFIGLEYERALFKINEIKIDENGSFYIINYQYIQVSQFSIRFLSFVF